MPKEMDFYVGLAREAIEEDADRMDLYQQIDEAVRCESPVPSEVQSVPWIGSDRIYTSTIAADARNAATRTFASKKPLFQIAPLSDEEMEYQRTETLERAMDWEFSRMGGVGTKSDFWKIVESAMTYGATAVNTEYLPYTFKGDTSRRAKAILAKSKFRWHSHHPGTVHPMEGQYGTDVVVKAMDVNAHQLINQFGPENKGIKEIISTFGEDDREKFTTSYVLYDVMTLTNGDAARCQWATTGSTIREPTEGIELRREDHGMSFLPWVITDYEDAILKTLVTSRLWKQLNIVLTLRFALAIEQVAHPRFAVFTPDGTLSTVDIDNTHPAQPLVSQLGNQVQALADNRMNTQILELVQAMDAEAHQTSVASILASVEKYAGTNAFSTVNAMMKGAEGQLEIGKMAASATGAIAMGQNFQWIAFSGIPLVSYRSETRDDRFAKGQEIAIYPPDVKLPEGIQAYTFDPEALYIDCKLQASHITDEQAALNNEVIMVERMGKSKAQAWEDLGRSDYNTNAVQKAAEDLFEALKMAEMKKLDPEFQMAMQAQEQAAAQAQAPQNQVQDMNGATQMEGVQGMNTRTGQSANPAGVTREQMTGQDMSGGQLA